MTSLQDIIAAFLPSAGDMGLLFWAKRLLVAMIVFSLFWMLAQIICYSINRWGGRFTSFTKTDLDDRLLKRTTPSISLLLTFLGLYWALRTLPLHEKFFIVLSGGLFVVNTFIICVVLYRVLHEFLLWYADRQQEGEGGAFARQMIPMVEKVAMLFIIGGALATILKHFNYDVYSLITAMGIGSLAIGLAAKETLSNVISGFTLMIDRPFRIGDRIQLSGGQIGDVHTIGLRSTKIKTLDNQLLIIPNFELCNTTLTNQAFPDNRIKGRINVGIGYDSDVEQVKALLVAIAFEVDDVLKEPLPEAFFVSFGDSALNMSLFFWVDDYSLLFGVTDTINSAIISRFREQRIDIPFPIRTVIMDKGIN